MLERLARSPSWIGIADAIDTRCEVQVNKVSGDLLGDVDLLVRTPYGLVIVEYKHEDSVVHAERRKASAVGQLEKLSSCFVERFGVRPRSVYAFGPRFSCELVDPGSFELDYVAFELGRYDTSGVF